MRDAWDLLGVPAGQCRSCRHALLNVTARGTAYLRCRQARSDPRLSRYPRLPVRECPGFAVGEPSRTQRGS